MELEVERLEEVVNELIKKFKEFVYKNEEVEGVKLILNDMEDFEKVKEEVFDSISFYLLREFKKAEYEKILNEFKEKIPKRCLY